MHSTIVSILLLVLSISPAFSSGEMDLPDFTARLTSVIGAYVNNEGYRISWATKQKDDVFTTSLSYLKYPTIQLYLPKHSDPLMIRGDKMIIDHKNHDLILSGNVTVRMKKIVLKTNFLKLDPKKLTVASYDRYELKTPQDTIAGQSFYGTAASGQLVFLNVKDRKTPQVTLGIYKE